MNTQRYTAGLGPKKLTGCESPKARGAKPHPARFAAFLFQARLGGSNGRAQVLPVTLRVPRSLTPVRAAAQCESWSAVVHQAQLEINMTATSTRNTAQAFTFIKRNEFNPSPCLFARLPFVADVRETPRKKSRSFWAVPQIDCYGTANVVGAQYAADWIQFLKQNPEWVGGGTTGQIAREMHGATSADGVSVGFWSLIEAALVAGSARVDAYAIAEQTASSIRTFLQQPEHGSSHD